MEWDKAITVGTKAEDYFMDRLREWNFENVHKNPSTSLNEMRAWDIKAFKNDREYTFEVKFDAESAGTGNIAFETHQIDANGNYVHSGLGVTKAAFWVQFIRQPDLFIIHDSEYMRQWVEKHSYRFMTMGDVLNTGQKRCLGHLVKKAVFLVWVEKAHVVNYKYDIELIKS